MWTDLEQTCTSATQRALSNVLVNLCRGKGRTFLTLTSHHKGIAEIEIDTVIVALAATKTNRISRTPRGVAPRRG